MIIYDAAFPSEVESVFTVSTVLDNCDFLYQVYFLSYSVLGNQGLKPILKIFPKGFFSILNGQWLGYLLTDVRFVNVTPDSRSILRDRSFAYLRQCWFVKINNALVVVEQTQSASFSSLPGGIGLWKCGFWGERKPGVCVSGENFTSWYKSKSHQQTQPPCVSPSGTWAGTTLMWDVC